MREAVSIPRTHRPPLSLCNPLTSSPFQVKKANPGIAVKDIASKLGEQWRALSDAQKDVRSVSARHLQCPLLIFLQAYKKKAEALKN
jgi:hypothetical protein